MSCSIALRRSPKPGALTATTLKVLRIELTTSVDSAWPSTSSATISSGLLAWTTFSSSGSSSSIARDLLGGDEDVRRRRAPPRRDSASVTKCGEMKPLSNCMPSVTSSSVASVEPSSTVMTPSRPTFSIASAIRSPMVASCAEMVATWAISVAAGDLDRLVQQRLDDRGDGRVDAALEAGRVGAGGHVAQALADHRLGQHGGGGGAVAGDVVGLGRDLLDELGAEVLVRVGELDLLGDGHAVVGDRRGAELLVQHDVAPARAERDLDRVGERVDAVLQQVPRVIGEAQDLRHACDVPSNAAPPRAPRRARVRGGDHCITLLGHFSMTARTSRAESTRYSSPRVLDLGAAVLRVDDRVADLDVDRDAVALVVDAAGADSEDGALLRLLLGGVRG